MSDKKEIRRKILKGAGAITVGQFALQRWTTPTVDAVILSAHAQMSSFMIACDISRGEEGSAPRVNGADLVIDATIRIDEAGIADGDTVDVRHQVIAAGYDQTFPGTVSEAAPNFYVGDVPFDIPLPVGVMAGQNLEIEVSVTSGNIAGGTCSESLLIN